LLKVVLKHNNHYPLIKHKQVKSIWIMMPYINIVL
jgi:hypothetical protein